MSFRTFLALSALFAVLACMNSSPQAATPNLDQRRIEAVQNSDTALARRLIDSGAKLETIADNGQQEDVKTAQRR
jgi:hypothetical protein